VTVLTFRRRVGRVTAIVACCFLFIEVVLVIKAIRARATAIQMLRAVDLFRLGATSKTEAETKLRELKLTPEDEACSAPPGSCEGIGVVLANYPQMSRGSIASVLGVAASEISVFRPTSLVGNFYFYSDRFQSAEVAFATDRTFVGTAFAATDSSEHAVSSWHRNNRSGHERYFRVLDPAHQKGTSLGSADIFDLGCMESFWGCNTDSQLWPSVSQYKTR
jgi:hypothetical protein